MSIVTISDKDGSRWFANRILIRGANLGMIGTLLRPVLHLKKVRRVDWTTEPIYEDVEQSIYEWPRKEILI